MAETEVFSLAYGRDRVTCSLPRRSVVQVLEAAGAPGLARTPGELACLVRGALREPVDSKPLAEIVSPGDSVTIVVNDQTRLARTELFLPLLLDELNLAGVTDAGITCLFALGAHRALSGDEMRELIGLEVFERVRTVNHDCRDESRLARVGRTSRGNEILVNSLLVESDRVILTGSIVYHFFAGFGGGRKAAVPGCASLSTIQYNHSLMLDPAAVTGRLDGNPVHEDLLEAARLVGPDFLFNVVLNERREIAGIFAGDLDAAHRRGCAFVDRVYGVPIERQTDLVIASCGGWPKDINVYQAQKAMDNAVQAARRGGIVILLAECAEGPGNDAYLEWMRRYRTPDAIAEATRRSFQLGGHKAYAVTRLLARAEIIMVSAMPPGLVRELLLTPASTLPEALGLAQTKLGPDPSITVMPDGSMTLPRLISAG